MGEMSPFFGVTDNAGDIELDLLHLNQNTVSVLLFHKFHFVDLKIHGTEAETETDWNFLYQNPG